MYKQSAGSALLMLSLVLAACGAAPVPPAAPAEASAPMETSARVSVTRVDITPASALLTAVGASVTLQAAAYDASGRRVSATVKWVSSNPAEVAVDAKGRATAKVAAGSSQITAEVNGVRSKPVLVSVVKLNPNVVVVTDAQITSGVTGVTPAPDGSAVGTQFQLTLSGVTPKPGQVLLSSGASPVTGQVLASVPSGKQAVVTLQTVPMSAVYQDLSVAQQVSLTSADVIPLTGADAPERVERHPDGSLSLSYRIPPVPARAPALRTQALPGEATLPGPYLEKEFTVGKFKCKTTLDTLIGGELLTLKIEEKVDVDVNATVTQGQLMSFNAVLNGELSGTVTGGLDMDIGAQGELKCQATFAQVPVPITGPLASFIAPSIPIGLAFSVDGKIKFGKVQFGLEGKMSTKRKVGLSYDGLTNTVTPINEGETTTTLVPKVHLPDPLADLRFEGGMTVQGVTGIGLTALPWLGPFAKTFNAVELTFGPRVEGNFAPELTQAEVGDYSSSYALKLVGGLGPGESLQELAGVLGSRNQWKLFNFAVSKEILLSRSPNGAISGPATATVGQPMTIAVDLNPSNVNFLPGVYAPSEVRVYRMRSDLTMEYAGVATPTPGQTHFEFPWTPTADDAGKSVVFRGFVSSGAFGIAALELDDDAKLSVAVSAADPSTPTPPPTPPAPTPAAWYGTITHEWAYNWQNAYDDGSTHTGFEKGKRTCTYSAVGEDGQQAFDWTYAVDHSTKTLYADGKFWLFTAQGDRAGSTTRAAGTLDITAMPEDYIIGIKKFYWSADNLLELGNWWQPMGMSTICSLNSVTDEDPSPDVIRGQIVSEFPDGRSVTTVNLVRR